MYHQCPSCGFTHEAQEIVITVEPTDTDQRVTKVASELQALLNRVSALETKLFEAANPAADLDARLAAIEAAIK